MNLEHLHGAEHKSLDYEDQAAVKRLMRRGLATIRNGVVYLAGEDGNALDRPLRRGNHRSPFGAM